MRAPWARRLPRPAYRAAAFALRGLGSVTSKGRLLPTMLVVGTQRGGTTSLFRTLRQHPDFEGPLLRKGVHFFDVEYERGFSWYRGHFPLRAVSAVRRRGRRIRPVVGEASPYYMSHPLAPERIAAHLPTARLVVLLRDPVERAYSAHAHERARGYETESFARAIELEDERLAGETERMLAEPGYQSHALRHHAYLARGRYVEQLERLEQFYPRERILVVDSHRFFACPEEQVAHLLGFVGLATDVPLRYERHNASPRSDLDPAVRLRLEDYFAPYDERLADWLGHAPSWRSPEARER